tara:strand:- start:56797 stop:57759 length:963 start_codon:yes stop_codon:yes gene_type:complete
MLESGKLVHKIGFDIDTKSWTNLNKFQKRISMLKQQMKGLNGAVDFKVNASGFRQQATKVAKIQAQANYQAQSMYKNKGGIGLEFGKARGADKTYSAWWEDALKAKGKSSSSGADMAKREQRITNLRNRLDYQMKKGGVGIQSSTAFMNGGFAKAAEGFRKTGDISAFSQQVSLASRKMIDSAKSAKTMGRSLHDMRGMMVAATAAYTAFSVVSNVANTGMQLESLKAGMKVFAGGDAGVRSEFDYIVAQSERMGINFEAAASQYTKFSIVARNKLDINKRKELFESMSEYATVLQVDPEQYKRAFNSINQMLSKGSVMS